jgi:hypothetical protein
VKLIVDRAALVGGVPLRIFPLKINHEGRLVAVQVIAPVPPVAAKEALYCTVGLAAVSGEVVVIVTGGFTVTDKGCALLTAPSASVTVTENA